MEDVAIVLKTIPTKANPAVSSGFQAFIHRVSHYERCDHGTDVRPVLYGACDATRVYCDPNDAVGEALELVAELNGCERLTGAS